LYIDTIQIEGAYAPSFHKDNKVSVDDFLRSVKVSAYSIINKSLRFNGFCPTMTESLFSGKMTRSKLAYSLGLSAGQPIERLINIACSMELLHEASLVHDDIQDKQTTRRGKPTIWKKYSINEAISWGDFLLSLSLDPFLQSGTITDIKHHNKVIQLMLEGQNLEQTSKNKKINKDDYFNIIKLKTGSLLELPIHLLISSASEEKTLLLEAMKSLGIAYQVKNDLVDFSRGKSSIDFKNKISTLPFLELYKVRTTKNSNYLFKDVFLDDITQQEFLDIKQKINPIIEKHTKYFIYIFKRNLSKDCFDILRKSFEIYFKRN
tara:strand:- start:5125 stop:6084 length:960 start_codon:yes stop_codon:yes gene_type:complete